jgi:hypothetical protein
MLDFFIVFISIVLGIICSVSINHILFHRKEKKSKVSEDIKSELNNLLLEKSIALEALNKIEKFFKEQKIDKNEKDNLVLKYNKILDNYDKRLLKLKPIVEIQDIYEYRNQLYSLISDHIEKLDKRLTDLSSNIDYFNTNNIKIDKKTSSVQMPLKALYISKRYKKNFIDKYKSLKIYIDKPKEKDIKISNYKDIKVNHTNSSNYTTDKDTNFISNFNSYKESTHLKNDNTLTDNINKTKEVVEEEGDKEINTDEIDIIQKDILKILQRLESSS